MGKVLQIRVIAQTFDENEVWDQWPALAELAWGKVTPERGHGVLELAATLEDKSRLGMLPDSCSQFSEEFNRAGELKRAVDSALGDWKPADAERISTELEGKLDELEKNIQSV